MRIITRKSNRSSYFTTATLLAVSLSAACGAPTDAEQEAGDESIGSVQLALTTPLIDEIGIFDPDDTAVIDCEEETPYAISAGFHGLGFGINDAYTTSVGLELWDSRVAAKAPSGFDGITSVALCSNARPTKRSKFESDGDAFANCASGEIALGGGAKCDDPSAKLFRSRPSPDVDGAEPTAWRASCTQGGVTTYALCRDKDLTYDFTGCEVERVDSTEDAIVFCDSGDLTISGGGYCGNEQPLSQLDVQPDLSRFYASCLGNNTTVHAYAICCPNVSRL